MSNVLLGYTKKIYQKAVRFKAWVMDQFWEPMLPIKDGIKYLLLIPLALVMLTSVMVYYKIKDLLRIK